MSPKFQDQSSDVITLEYLINEHELRYEEMKLLIMKIADAIYSGANPEAFQCY